MQDGWLADGARRHGLRVDPRLPADPQRSAIAHGLVGHDLPELVQRTYGNDPLGSASWQAALGEAAAGRGASNARRRHASAAFRLDVVPARAADLVGWLHTGVGDAEDDPRRGTAQVRDGDEETLEVLVVVREAEGGLGTPDWIARGAGLAVPWSFEPNSQLTRVVAACALRLPPGLSHPGAIDHEIEQLERRQHIPGLGLSPLLAGQLVLRLDPDRSAVLRAGDRTRPPHLRPTSRTSV